MQLLLAVVGVALGVAVFVGVELANDSAGRAFAESQQQLSGRATHQLVGAGDEISSEVYRSLRLESGTIAAAPVVETRVVLLGHGNRRVVLLGIDPLEESAFRSYSGGSAGTDSRAARLLAEPQTVLVPSSLATELGLAPEDKLSVALDRREAVELTIIDVVGDDDAESSLNLPLVADIATVAELRGRDSLSRIDLVLTPKQADLLERSLPPGVTLVTAPSRARVFDELSSAFRLNLTALSLLALLVGMFLIYATVSFAVVQRRSALGIFRAIGVQRRALLVSVALEALVLGAVATALGLLLGYALSRGLVSLVLATIGDFYFSSTVRAAAPSHGLLALGFAVGIGCALVAAALPAIEAMRVSPRAAMSRAALERTAGRMSRYGAALAGPGLAVGLLLIVLFPRSLHGAFAGLFVVIVAAALTVPLTAGGLLRIAAPLLARTIGVAGALAARGVAAALSRTGVATAALTVAVATVIGIGLMIASFRGSVERWLESTLLADFYADVGDWTLPDGDPLTDPTLARLLTIPGVRGLSLMQFNRLPVEAGELSIRAVLPGPDGWGLTLTDAVGPDALSRLANGDGVLVSEALAFRRALAVGSTLPLPTRYGLRDFRILGVYREYNTDGGGVLLPLDRYRIHWSDRALDGLGVYLADDADRQLAAAAVSAVLDAYPEVRLRSTEAIRQRSLEVFDRTFRITEVLRLLAGTVAFFGLLSALLAIELDRGREIAVLRAIGFTPRQIGTLSIAQTALLGGIAGLLAIPLGIAMAGLLVHVINRRSFGWGMELALAPGPLLVGFAMAIAAACLAGAYPALRLTRQSVASRLREE
jgi:putative ABC transport system permease protein